MTAVLAVVAALAAASVMTAVAAAGRVPARRATSAAAATSQPGLTLGISGAVSQLTSGSSASEAGWTAKAHAVGAQIIRLDIGWSSIAPTTLPAGFNAASQADPNYNWTATDAEVRQLTSEGFQVFIEVSSAPTWAEAGSIPSSANPGAWDPNATDFGQFATALATRYDGHTADPLNAGQNLPRVRYWQAWNEPNLSQYLEPQWKTATGTQVPESPIIYRSLENAFYKSVKAVSTSNYVVAAGTAPYGDPPGGQRMSPVTFDQSLLCLTTKDTRSQAPCSGPTYMDAIDDHPYVSGLCCLGPTWHAALAADTSIADMYKIVDVLKGAEKAKTVAPAGGKQNVWASEIGWNTDPPNPNPNEASSDVTVGKWATQALYILWRQGVSTVLWYQLADDPENPAGWAYTYTEGLYLNGGAAKPAAAAFAFPFLTFRKSSDVVETWGRAPAGGTLTVQEKNGAKWTTAARVKVKADQVFEVPVGLSSSGTFRAVVAGHTSPSWSQSA